MENRHRTYQRQSMGLVFFLFVLVLLTLLGRLFYLMIGKADYYGAVSYTHLDVYKRQDMVLAEHGLRDCVPTSYRLEQPELLYHRYFRRFL